MTDWGRSGRTDEYTYHLVDPFTLAETGQTLESVDGEGSITWGLDAENRYSAQIPVYSPLDMTKLIRVKHTVVADGATSTRTLGTFFIESIPESANVGLIERSMACYSTAWRYTQDILQQDFPYNKGQNCIANIRKIVTDKGGKLVLGAGCPTSKTHTLNGFFSIGENVMEVLNKYAGWINCEIYPNANGEMLLVPKKEDKAKPISYTFEDGENCVCTRGVEHTDNVTNICNKVVAWFTRTSKSDDDEFPLSDKVVLWLDKSKKYSYQKIGRAITHEIKAQPCSHADLEKQAREYLDENSVNHDYYEIEHVSIPGLEVGQAVRYKNSTDLGKPINILCVVEQISMTLGRGGMCKTKLRVV